jgi:flagellar hook-associated protein 3 FlgL
VRITEGIVSRRVMSDLGRTRTRIADAQEQVSTGKRLVRPSIDPLATERAMRLRADLAETRQHQRNVADAQDWLDITDDALGTIGEVIHRAREIVVQGANPTVSRDDRDGLAKQIDALVDQAKSAANARFGDQYVLAGQATDVQPYAPGGPDGYAPAGAPPVVRTIGPGVSVQLGVLGRDVLGDGSGGLIKDLREIAAHLRGATHADTEALRADLTDLQARETDVLGARASVGALGNRLEAAAGRLDQLALTTDTARSDIEDADLARTLVDLTSQQSAYEAALKAGSSVMQRSLMDFLR